MAIDFTADAYYTTAGAAATIPMSMCLFANPDSVTGGAEGMFFTQAAEGSGVDMHSFLLWHINAQYLYSVYDGTAMADIFSSAAAAAADTWTCICGVSASTTDHKLYVDGVEDGSSTTSITPVPDTIGVGVQRGNATNQSLLTGRAAEAAIWDVALNTDEITALAEGISPRLIRPASLRALYVEWDTTFAGTDMSGNGNDLGTTVGAPADFDHVGIYRPTSPRTIIAPAIVAATNRLLTINPPGLDGGFGTGLSL